MPLSLHNTLSRTREPFQPLEPGKVKMYICGPTVYNYIHVGNARPLVFFDVTRRYLEASGYQVNFVINYTDVDDKIIERARQENTPWTDITAKYIAAYENDMKSLGIKAPAKMPKVSEHIPQIIRTIEGLIKNDVAYVQDGEVFFSVRKFAGYGKLSGKNIDDLRSGARVEVDAKKHDPLDFSLWKPRKTESEPAWDSPWGKGRPGWHIECSAMAMEYLGETFDIHGGGMDLIHPHHENEIAQSEGCTKKPFARYWLHNNMLAVNAEKMSKSLGNIFLTKDFIRLYLAETLKFLLLSGHYRSTIDFSERSIRDAQSALHRYYSCVKRCEVFLKEGKDGKPDDKIPEFATAFEPNWRESMDDDLNTAKVVGMVFEYVRLINAALDKKALAKTEAERFLANMKKLSEVFNILGEPADKFLGELRGIVIREKGIEPAEIDRAIQERIEARQKKDFATSDRIRKEMSDKGIELRDTPRGTEWDVILA